MLSIRFSDRTEWWVSGKTFDRLFRAGLEAGTIAPEMERWWHVANACGGLELTLLEPNESQELARALCETAEKELSNLEERSAEFEDEAYWEALLKLQGAK